MRDKTYDNRGTTSAELWLIRAGHHLWRQRKRKEWPETAVMSALETIWAAKKAIRAIERENYRQSREKSNLHLSKGNRFARFGKLAPVVDVMEALKASLKSR